MNKFIKIIVIASLLSGCSDGTPMKLSEEHKNYIGVWQTRFEKLEINSIEIDNMLLIINPDSSAKFVKCQIRKREFNNYRENFRNTASISPAAVTKITENQITLVQELGWFGFKLEVDVDNVPYQENEKWYIDIKGKKLAKLTDKDIHGKIDWVCPSDEE